MMELAYLWIEDFRGIKKQGFNFSNNDFFESYLEKDIFKIKHKKRKGSIPDNFFKRRDGRDGYGVQTVTAIIGKNGTGKSNIIDFLLHKLFTGNRSQSKNYLVIFKEDNKYLYLLKSNTIDDITFDECNDCQYNKVNDINDIEKEWNGIYFSNVADGRRYLFEQSKLINLSYKQNIKSASNKLRYLIDFYENKESSDSRSYLEDLLFPIDKISIELSIHGDKTFDDNLLQTDVQEKFRSIRNRFYKAFKESTSGINILIYSITFSVFCSLLSEFVEFDDNNLITKFLNNVDDKNGMAEEISSLHPKVLSFLENVKNTKNVKLTFNLSLFIKGIIYLSKESDNKKTIDKEKNKGDNRLIVNLNNTLYSFIKEYVVLFDNSNIIQHDWANVSSGMKAYLTMFSNLFVQVDVINRSAKKNILICIDEGDLYFHPEMQRNFLDNTIDFLNKKFKKKRIQVILTSHSPFIVADLPINNLVLLDRVDSSIVEKISEEKSFSSNIYKLFKNQFFLKNSTLGQFAKNKLEHTILDIRSVDTIEDPILKDAEAIIDHIGEPVIKEKMLNLLSQELSVERKISLLKKQKELIEHKIEELKEFKSSENDKN